jgi:hypothetical protein
VNNDNYIKRVNAWFNEHVALAMLRAGYSTNYHDWPKDEQGLGIVPTTIGRAMQRALPGMEHLDLETLRIDEHGRMSGVMKCTIRSIKVDVVVGTDPEG